jgi:threonine/homoserine/homoserine lactone efflux protein
MGQAIGELLPAAVGVALSPIPIVAVVLMLASERGRVNGPAFVVGWVVGIAVAGTALLLIAGAVGGSDHGQPATWVSWLELLLGLALLRLALKQFRGRPRGAEEAELPRWMGAIDHFTPAKAVGAGVALAAVNPKNFVLILAAVAVIAQTGIPAGEQAVALAVFAVIASTGAAAPVVIYFAGGERSAELLERLRVWMARYNAVILAAILTVIGAKVIGDAISGLSS